MLCTAVLSLVSAVTATANDIGLDMFWLFHSYVDMNLKFAFSRPRSFIGALKDFE